MTNIANEIVSPDLERENLQPLAFVKMHGCGNDFVVINANGFSKAQYSKIAPLMLNRNFGVGGDGLIVFASAGNSEAELLLFNSDGSVMGMCGNGVRCATQYFLSHLCESFGGCVCGISAAGKKVIKFKIGPRLVEGQLESEISNGSSLVKVSLGAPSFDPKSIPVSRSAPLINEEVMIGNATANPITARITAVSMGNPHAVIFLEDREAIDVGLLGPMIERDPLFPQRTNVEFVQVYSREKIAIRVWERGVGITLACGSGACAAVAAGVVLGKLERQVEVELDGGTLEVSWLENGEMTIIGPVKEVFAGNLSQELLVSWLS